MARLAGQATAAGPSGRLRVGHQTAAELGAWTASLAPVLPRSYVVRADVRAWHDYWRTQRPLTVALEFGGATWEWAGVEPVEEAGDVVSFAVRGAPTIIRFAAPRERSE